MKRLFFWLAASAIFLPALPARATVPASDGPPEMVTVPAGEFWMGRAEFQWLFDRNTEIERERLDDRPAHRIYLDSFAIDKYEVTNEEYLRYVKATGTKPPWYWPHGAFPEGQARFPVYNVNFDEATAYCKWAGKRLPTEAEWERAARGGQERKKYPWGDDDQLRNRGRLDAPEGPVEVGTFPPNGYGLYDITGNVWEWTSDWYDRDYYSISPDRNPKGPDTGLYKIIRGGGWTDGYDARNLMVSHRSYVDPTVHAFTIGIRCAK